MIDAKVRHLRRGPRAERPHALLREPRIGLRLRRLRASARGGDGAGAGRDRDVRAASRAARSRHSRDHLRESSRRARPPNRSATRSSATYGQEPFVRLTGDALPEIKHVAWTNFCDIGWRLDSGSRRLVIVACLDNLVKGAAGQAMQNFNVACRLRRTDGAAVTDPARAEARRRAARIACRSTRIAVLRGLGGGDPAARALCTAAGAPSTPSSPSAASRRRKVDGLRVTDAATLDVVVVGAGRHGEHRAGGRARRPGCSGRRADGCRRRPGTRRARTDTHQSTSGVSGRSGLRRRSGRGRCRARRAVCSRAGTCRSLPVSASIEDGARA